jgi:hypothetical protein
MIHLIKTIIGQFSHPLSSSGNTLWTFEETVANFEGNIEEIIIG